MTMHTHRSDKDGVDDMQELRERLQALRDRIAHVVARL